jgi:hypothetical protein
MFKTIGNGVPYLVATALAKLISETLDSAKMDDLLDLANKFEERHFSSIANQPIQLELR